MAKKKSSSSALPGVFALMTLLLGVLGVVLMYTLELIGFGLQLGDKKSDAAMIVGKDVMFGSKSQYGDLDLLKPTPMAIVSWVLLLAGAALGLMLGWLAARAVAFVMEGGGRHGGKSATGGA